MSNDFPPTFLPDESLGFYETVKSAILFLTDNFWKGMGDSEISALIGPKSSIDDNFHLALINALSGTKNVIADKPQNEELPKLIPIFEHTIPAVGIIENSLISIIHGQEISTLQRRLGDEQSTNFRENLIHMLDAHLETHSELLVAELVVSIERYLAYIRGLALAYEKKTSPQSETKDLRNVQSYEALINRLEEKIEGLWLLGVMENAEWA